MRWNLTTCWRIHNRAHCCFTSWQYVNGWILIGKCHYLKFCYPVTGSIKISTKFTLCRFIVYNPVMFVFLSIQNSPQFGHLVGYSQQRLFTFPNYINFTLSLVMRPQVFGGTVTHIRIVSWRTVEGQFPFMVGVILSPSCCCRVEGESWGGVSESYCPSGLLTCCFHLP